MNRCEWNPEHIVSNYNDEKYCSSCSKKYFLAFTELVNWGKQLRKEGVPRKVGGQTSYMDWWLYECFNRLASPVTGMLYIDTVDMVSLVERNKGEITKSLTRLEEKGMLDLYKNGNKRVYAVYVHESDEVQPITV